MRAALRLRLLEARRRGGLLLLLCGVVAVAWIALQGGETPDGRYGLATDVAAALAYVAAVFYGAYPLAVDRERKRAYVPGASPVTPWMWALGNAAGGAVVGFVAALVLLATAGAASALGGGIATYAVTRPEGVGTQWLPPQGLRIRVRADATELRILPRVHLRAEETVGSTDAATLEVGGRTVTVFPDRPVRVPIEGPRVLIRNLSPEHMVGFDRGELRAFGEERSFLANAAGAAVAPALGAAGLAALGAAAGANLTAPVAALLTALILCMASLKGFLLDTLQHEGVTRAAVAHGAHSHGVTEDVDASALQATARGLVRVVLHVLPDLSDLDRTDRVALGEWTGLRRSAHGLAMLAIALATACVVGGAGIHSRRLP